MNRWSPYFLSILRIIAAFAYGVHGTQKLFGFPAPFAVPHLPPLFFGRRHDRDFRGLASTDWTLHSTLRLRPFRRDVRCLLQVPCTAGILAAAERWGRRGALLLHFPISRQRGWRAVECFRSFLLRSLRNLNGGALSPCPTEALSQAMQAYLTFFLSISSALLPLLLPGVLFVCPGFPQLPQFCCFVLPSSIFRMGGLRSGFA